jgi:hypothetical protein
MKVVVEETVRVELDAEALVYVGQSLAEFDSIGVIEEHVAVIDATVHHVVPSVFDVDAQWSGHAAMMNPGCYIAGLTPDVISRGRGRGSA